ncbi:MAG TPA: hypothetical protein VF035_09730 [Longimicrobiales bacterium]
MMRRLFVLPICAVAALATLPLQGAAQTLFSTRGLGAPIRPIDARATALGGSTTGLFGFNLAFDNPAEASGILRRGASATIQPSWTKVDLGGGDESIGGSRFPLIRVIYPVSPRLTATLGYGGYLDQTWGVVASGEEVLGTDTIGTTDVLRSQGGVSQIRFGFAYSLTDNLAVGLTGGMYTGSLDRSIRRTFEDTVSFQSFESRLRWSYKAPQATIGARWDAMTGVRLGAAVTVGGKLKASAEEGVAEDREYGAPMKLTAGGSAQVSRDLMVTAGLTRERFPEVTSEGSGVPGSAGTSTHDVWQYGGGVEYTGMRNATRTLPLRLGGRMGTLPYAGATEEAPKEWAVSFGTGFTLATEQRLPQALLDVSLERAGRKGLESTALPDGLSESFWRLNVSLSLFGR